MIFQLRHIPAKRDGCQPSALQKRNEDESFPHPRSRTFMPSLGPSSWNTCCSLRKHKKGNAGSFLISLLACFFSFLPLCPGEGRLTTRNGGSAESCSGSERGWGSFSLFASRHADVFFIRFSSKPSFCQVFSVKNCPRWLRLRSVDLMS